MNRRGFLGSIAAFAAACALDPERALWVSGAKTISIPAPRLEVIHTIPVNLLPISFAVGDIITIGGLPYEFIVIASGESGGITGTQLKMTEQSIARAVARRRHTRHMDRRRGA